MLLLARPRLRCQFYARRASERSLSLSALHSATNALISGDAVSAYPPSGKGPLAGLRLAIKDNICTKSLPTSCSSKILENFHSPFDATVVSLLSENGAEIVGKANCDEFGMGSLNTYSVHGPVVNPFGLRNRVNVEKRSAGGSSGGSAAAVAAHMCDAALGTDTGGSVRLPASYCGVVGFKPSYGIISRWGVVSFADSLDCVGVLARDVPTVRRVYDCIAHYDGRDPTAALPHIRTAAKQSCEHLDPFKDTLTGLRIGVPQEYFPTELESGVVQSVRRVLEQLQARGATLVPVSLPSTLYALSAYYVISSAEASSNLARYDGIEYGMRADPPPGANLTKTTNVYAYTRSSGFGEEVQRRILLGTYALSSDAFENYFLQAQRVRKLMKADFDSVFCIPNALSSASSQAGTTHGVHALIHPSAIQTAPMLRDPDNVSVQEASSALDSYVQDVMTVPASLAGLPALSVPGGQGVDGWPIGVSVVGQWGCDELVMRVGEIIERCSEDGS